LAEIDRTVGRVGPELEDGDGSLVEHGELGLKAMREGGKVKRRTHRVACLSVGKLEIEHFGGGDAMAGRGQGDSGRSEIAEAETGSRYEAGHGICQLRRSD
jgi:hypothetical protein